MSARSSKVVLHEQWREKIRASMLLNRLRDHVLGKCELSATQVRAAEVLLRKVLPDLAAVEHTGEVTIHAFAVPALSAQSDAIAAAPDQPSIDAPKWERITVQ